MENDKGMSSTIMVMENDKGMSSTIMPEKMSFSRAFTMPGATEGNTSPISSVLRLLALDDVAQAAEITSVSKLGRESCTQAECSALAMLAPLDEWMSQPLELQGLSILRKSLLVSSPGLVSSKETEMEGTSVNEFLGGIGRDNLPGHNTEDLDAFKIYSVMAQTSRAINKSNIVSESAAPTGHPEPSAQILRCFVHERVIRDLRKRCMPKSYIREIVVEKIIVGSIIRGNEQYQKKVGTDVYELRVDEKIRMLFARSKEAVLILDIVWNHKLDIPIKRAELEMSMMKQWMSGSGDGDKEPFVMIDWVSGRLRPLYILNILYDAKSGENVDDVDAVFNPSMLDLVLSPGQKEACEKVMATAQESSVYEKDTEIHSSASGSISRDPINVVVFQGSAGNGKTTCLLRSGLSRAKVEEKVIFIAATQIFADSVEQDLKGNITKDFRIVVKNKFTEMIRSVFAQGLSDNRSDYSETTPDDVFKWLEGVESRKSQSGKSNTLNAGAMKALCEWLIKGHREAADTAFYKEYVCLYLDWKKKNKKRDEGDMWNDVILKLIIENNDDEGRSMAKADGLSDHVKNLDRECDMLVIDEAHLYPAETYFMALMLWYRPRKTLLLGMDTKQAVYLGCSNRAALLKAIHKAGWHQRNVMPCTLKTNFRLPARLVALSNAMVSTLKHFFGKVFDEYQMDEGYEARSMSAPEAAGKSDASFRLIENFPAMLVFGAAAGKLRKEICKRMKSNRRSVLSMRFANIDLESAPGNYNVNDSRSCTLGDLPTIKFQAVSGLEISLPVIVDCLLTTYIDKMCPRGLFAAYERKEILSDHENSMMRTALCTIYTVLTRCRGPLIWLEDDLKDKANPHPLVNRLKEALSETSMNIDFVTDPKKIDGKFLDRIFSLIDLDEVNDAYEESTFQILRKFKTSFFACSARLTDLMRKASPEESVRNIPAELQSTDEYLLLKEDERLLLSQLEVSVHIGAKECRHYLGTFSDTLLLKAGGGDGSWATEWGQDHKDIMEAVKCFPKTSRLILRDTTMAITAAPTSFEDSTGRLQHRSMERQLARHALRMCTCGDAPLSQDIKFVLAFKGKNLQIGAPTSASAVSKAGGTASCSPEIVWVVHQVTERINGSWECITGKSYLLSCFSKEGADQIGMDSQDQCRRMSTMLFKYEADAELTITRTDDGWLTLHERTFIAAGAVLAHSTSINAGMKCRCRARGVSLAGSARNHSYGPFVVEIKKQIMGCSMKCGRNKGALDTDVLWMPPVGDERMIRLLDALFSGIEIDFDAVGRDFFSSSSPSSSGTVSKHRAAAAFVWNNLLGGKMLFAGVEARLQPWALLLPSLTASMTGPQKVREVAALALLDQMRRTVEAYLLLERGSLIGGQLPSFISRDSIVELRCPGRNKLAV